MDTAERWRLAKILTLIITIVLIFYVTLDFAYIHIWFNMEDAVLVPIIQGAIGAAGSCCLAFIQQKQKQVQSQMTAQEKTAKVKSSRAWYLVAFFLGIIGGIIGYVIVKDYDKPLANRLLILGLATTLSVASYVTFLNAVLLKPIPIPMPPT